MKDKLISGSVLIFNRKILLVICVFIYIFNLLHDLY